MSQCYRVETIPKGRVEYITAENIEEVADKAAEIVSASAMFEGCEITDQDGRTVKYRAKDLRTPTQLELFGPTEEQD